MRKIKLTLEDINRIADRIVEFDDTYQDEKLVSLLDKDEEETKEYDKEWEYDVTDMAKSGALVKYIHDLYKDNEVEELHEVAMYIGDILEKMLRR